MIGWFVFVAFSAWYTRPESFYSNPDTAIGNVDAMGFFFVV